MFESARTRLTLAKAALLLALTSACGDEVRDERHAVVEIAVGPQHTCARRSDGTVWCWGANSHGQLGDGSTEDSAFPRQVLHVSDVAQVATGSLHTCTLNSRGTVSCWGFNGDGALGDGTTVDHTVPEPVPGLFDVVEVACSQQTCARRRDGTVWCWGHNGNGELGIGSEDSDPHPSPIEIAGLVNVAGLALGGFHACVRLASGQAQCFGANSFGQVGDGTTMHQPSPKVVQGIADVSGLAVGIDHTCSWHENGTLSCWGANYDGELGMGTTLPPYSTTPVSVPGLSGVAQAVAGLDCSCALLAGAGITCWGNNEFGQVGADSSDEVVLVPTAVQRLGPIGSLSMRSAHGCAIAEDGSLWCWGWNNRGQLGDGTTRNRSTPVPVLW